MVRVNRRTRRSRAFDSEVLSKKLSPVLFENRSVRLEEGKEWIVQTRSERENGRECAEEGDVERKDVAPNKWQLPALTSNGTPVVYNQPHSGLYRSASRSPERPFPSPASLFPLSRPHLAAFPNVHPLRSIHCLYCQVTVEGPGEHRVLGRTPDRFSISPSISLSPSDPFCLILSPLSRFRRRVTFRFRWCTTKSDTLATHSVCVAPQTRQRAVPSVVLSGAICGMLKVLVKQAFLIVIEGKKISSMV